MEPTLVKTVSNLSESLYKLVVTEASLLVIKESFLHAQSTIQNAKGNKNIFICFTIIPQMYCILFCRKSYGSNAEFYVITL